MVIFGTGVIIDQRVAGDHGRLRAPAIYHHIPLSPPCHRPNHFVVLAIGQGPPSPNRGTSPRQEPRMRGRFHHHNSRPTLHSAVRSRSEGWRATRLSPPSARSGGRADICARARLQHDRTSKGAPCAPSKPSHSTAFPPAPLTVEGREFHCDDSKLIGLITSTDHSTTVITLS